MGRGAGEGVYEEQAVNLLDKLKGNSGQYRL